MTAADQLTPTEAAILNFVVAHPALWVDLLEIQRGVPTKDLLGWLVTIDRLVSLGLMRRSRVWRFRYSATLAGATVSRAFSVIRETRAV